MTDIYCGAGNCRFLKNGKCGRDTIHLNDNEVWHACDEASTTDEYREKMMSLRKS